MKHVTSFGLWVKLDDVRLTDVFQRVSRRIRAISDGFHLFWLEWLSKHPRLNFCNSRDQRLERAFAAGAFKVLPEDLVSGTRQSDNGTSITILEVQPQRCFELGECQISTVEGSNRHGGSQAA